MMRSKRVHIICILMSGLLLGGCGNAIADMSEQTEDKVAQYAAGLVLDQTPHSGSRLVDTSVEFNPDKMSKYEKRKLGIAFNDDPPPLEESADAENPEGEGGENGSASGQESIKEEPQFTLAQVMGHEELQIELTGYSVLDSYPEGSSQDVIFSMNATTGNKLLLARVSVTNNAAAPVQFNTIGNADLHFRMTVNGETDQNALITLIPDDLASQDASIAVGETLETVLICEISEDLASHVSKVGITAISGVGKAKAETAQMVAAAAPAAENEAPEGESAEEPLEEITEDAPQEAQENADNTQ